MRPTVATSGIARARRACWRLGRRCPTPSGAAADCSAPDGERTHLRRGRGEPARHRLAGRVRPVQRLQPRRAGHQAAVHLRRGRPAVRRARSRRCSRPARPRRLGPCRPIRRRTSPTTTPRTGAASPGPPVTSTSASAASNGGRSLGVGEATAENARSWVTSTVECDVVTVIAGWAASNVVVAPGVTAEQMGERVTLVVGPDGASSDVEITLVGVEGAGHPGLRGPPCRPVHRPHP